MPHIIDGNILFLLEWSAFYQIFIKKNHSLGPLPYDYQRLLQDYVDELVHTKQLTPLKIHPQYTKRHPDFLTLDPLDRANFREFITTHALTVVIQQELIAQLQPFKHCLLANSRLAFIQEWFPTPSYEDPHIESLLEQMTLSESSHLTNARPRLQALYFTVKLRVYLGLKRCCPTPIKTFILSHQKKTTALYEHRVWSPYELAKLIKKCSPPPEQKQLRVELTKSLYYHTIHLLKQGQLHAASIILELFFRQQPSPDFIPPLYAEGKALLNHHGHAQAAHIIFFMLIKWYPETDELCHHLARTAFLTGQHALATLAYTTSIFFEKTLTPMLCHNLGYAFIATHQLTDGIRMIQRAIQIEPTLNITQQNSSGQCRVKPPAVQPLDLTLTPFSILYTAYHELAENLLHAGRHEGLAFYKAAINAQASESTPALPIELRELLAHHHMIDIHKPFRILPYEWVTHIGHLAGNLDSYIKIKQLNQETHAVQTILLAPSHKVASAAYLSLLQPHLHIVENLTLAEMLYPYQRYFGDSFNAYIKTDGTVGEWFDLASSAQIEWEATNQPPVVQLPSLMHTKGEQYLRKMGINKSDWFVCFHMRHSGTHYGDKQIHRNTSVADYLAAIQWITQQGGFVIRMGDASMEPLPPLPRVIDYPHTAFKSDWMDIFLSKQARFFVSAGESGMLHLPISLGTPCVVINATSCFRRQWNRRVLFTPKHLWNQHEKRYLTFSEMMADTFRWNILNNNRLQALGIEPQTNTSDEILSVIQEAFAKLHVDDRFPETAADHALAKEYARAEKPFFFGSGRLSEAFLERHADTLLE